ncbi:MAG: hypothetical protein R2823_00065 [Acidimicrobiia bacterium]
MVRAMATVAATACLVAACSTTPIERTGTPALPGLTTTIADQPFEDDRAAADQGDAPSEITAPEPANQPEDSDPHGGTGPASGDDTSTTADDTESIEETGEKATGTADLADDLGSIDDLLAGLDGLLGELDGALGELDQSLNNDEGDIES